MVGHQVKQVVKPAAAFAAGCMVHRVDAS